MLRLRVAAALLVVAAGACGDTEPPELRTIAGAPAVVPEDLPRPSVRVAPTTTTTSRPAPPAPVPPPVATTTTTSAVVALQAPPTPAPPPPAPAPGGDCLGWASTIARHFPPDQHARACSVLRCETGGTGDPTIHNPSSSASGLWQFLDGTWESTTGTPAPAAAYSGDVQTAAAAKLWRSSGWSPWSCA